MSEFWSPIPIPSYVPFGPAKSEREATRLRLFVQTYDSGKPDRQKELEFCLAKNKALGFLEVVELPAQDRLTFRQFFDAANAMNPDDDTVSIFANSDIRFDRTIRLVRFLRAGDAWCLSRWRTESFIPDGHNPDLTPGYAIGADVWAIRGRIKPVKADFGMGMAYCDYSIAGVLKAVGYNLANPCWSVRTWHHHASGHRTYDILARTPKPWIYTVSPSRMDDGSIPQSPPVEKREAAKPLDPKNWAAFTKTLLTRGKVQPEVQEPRKAACTKPCDYYTEDKHGHFCSVPGGCGCRADPLRVAWVQLRLVDISLYEEPEGEELLCKHPKRKEGKGWPLPLWAQGSASAK